MDTSKMDDWKKNLVSAMTDDQLGNFLLVGSDNVEISCSKFLLAVQSPVFKKMFFGQFKERDSERLLVSYHSSINRVIVTYCHSGVLDLSSIWVDQKTNNANKTKAEIKRLLELRDAGRYFELDRILLRAEQEIAGAVFSNNTDLNDSSRVCSTVLQEMLGMGESNGAFWDAFFQFAIENPMNCFDFSKNISGNGEEDRPHPELLTRILKGIPDTSLLIQCLQAWSTPREGDGETETISGIAYEALDYLACRVDLRNLSTAELVKLNDCSLFSSEQLLEAFVHQHSSPRGPTMKSPTFTTTTEIFVTGAGVGTANGYYEMQGSSYIKQGEYGEIPCKYQIKLIGSQWTLSVTIMKDGPYGDTSTVQLYQGHGRLGGYAAFNDWKCLEGAAPAPMVAYIRKRKRVIVSSAPVPAPAPTVPWYLAPAPAPRRPANNNNNNQQRRRNSRGRKRGRNSY